MIGGSNASAARAGAAVLLGCLICCASGVASAVGDATVASSKTPAPNVVRNGEFSVPASEFSNNLVAFLSPEGYAVNKLPVKGIRGWAIGEGIANGVTSPNLGGVVVTQKARVQAPAGSAQSVELSDNGPGSISQTVKTVPGSTYLLSWYGAGYPDGKSVKVIDVSWNGAQVGAASFKGGTGANMGWKLHHEVVKATAKTSKLEFADGTSATDPYGPFLGAVSLTKQ